MKAVPTHLKLILGNPGRRPLPDLDKLPPSSIPDCPDHLGDTAKAEWDRIVPLLNDMGLLTRADMAQLAGYCAAYGRWREVEHEIKEAQKSGKLKGLLVKTPNGYPQISPLLVISNKSQEQMHKFAAEFGLSPVMRTKVESMLKGSGANDNRDPLEKLLRASERIEESKRG